eukprot:m.546008 g.546008  ORF g.546008 m.546008 type:complete len:57 (-) comp57677_c0_seq18:270-440(-)
MRFQLLRLSVMPRFFISFRGLLSLEQESTTVNIIDLRSEKVKQAGQKLGSASSSWT